MSEMCHHPKVRCDKQVSHESGDVISMSSVKNLPWEWNMRFDSDEFATLWIVSQRLRQNSGVKRIESTEQWYVKRIQKPHHKEKRRTVNEKITNETCTELSKCSKISAIERITSSTSHFMFPVTFLVFSAKMTTTATASCQGYIRCKTERIFGQMAYHCLFGFISIFNVGKTP